MILVFLSLWPALAAALGLGLVIGALTGLPRGGLAMAAAGLLLTGLAILTGLAALRTMPGAPGLWIESGALLLGAYLAGCVLGGFGRSVSGRPL
ncbi:hypothetical protein LPC10_15840 [Methylorubrum sp. B1-46]|jgi:hypothetical protein|uniref:hypothetical protein n=1 Tax=Methylorubrum sp. B1-46 TaxID=2897334 RepID=UPI001E542B41|nr:hypothetical protein [Methylorubrum sp. B1-46]UGB24422.1 hypothetical protein LPC10_15840 [Methylorubrum sp. B1-46]